MILKDDVDMIMILAGASGIFAGLALVFAAAALLYRRKKRKMGGCASWLFVGLLVSLSFLALPSAVHAASQNRQSEAETEGRRAESGETEKTGTVHTETVEIEVTETETAETEDTETETAETAVTETETAEPAQEELRRLLQEAEFVFLTDSGQILPCRDGVLQTGGIIESPDRVQVEIRIRTPDVAKAWEHTSQVHLQVDGGPEEWQREAAARFEKAESWSVREDASVWTLPLSDDGEIRLQIMMKSDAEKAEQEVCAECVFLLDTQAPELYLENVRGDRFYSNQDLVIAARIRDVRPDASSRPEIEAKGVAAQFSGWEKTTDGLMGEIHLSGEGRALLWLTARDLAGNKADPVSLGPLILDRTAPTLQIMAPEGRQAGNTIYASRQQDILITAEDACFDPGQGELLVETVDGSWQAGDWQLVDGQWHRHLYLTGDGNYLVTAVCRDLAGNRAEQTLPQRIIVDTVRPEITVTGISAGASSAKAVSLSIGGQDGSLSAGSMQAVLYNQLTGEEREVTLSGKDAVSCIMTADADGIYLLRVKAEDGAGNPAEKELRFRVNLSGSRIDPAPETADLLLSGFMKQASPIVLTEKNIDPLLERRILLSGSGGPRILQEGQDYQVEELQDGKEGYLYRYTISGDCFREEGEYSLHIYSKDAAGNEYEGGRKRAILRFTADYRAPKLSVSGLEDGAVYRAKELPFTIFVSDTVAVGTVRVYVGGRLLQEYDAEDIWSAGGIFSLCLPAAPYEQEVRVEAEDAAGRRAAEQIRRVLVQAEDAPVLEERKKQAREPASPDPGHTENREEVSQYQIPQLIRDAADGFADSRDAADEGSKGRMPKMAALLLPAAGILPGALLIRKIRTKRRAEDARIRKNIDESDKDVI